MYISIHYTILSVPLLSAGSLTSSVSDLPGSVAVSQSGSGGSFPAGSRRPPSHAQGGRSHPGTGCQHWSPFWMCSKDYRAA